MTKWNPMDAEYKYAKMYVLAAFEAEYFTRLLEKHDGNISHAAKASGVDRKTIHRKLKAMK